MPARQAAKGGSFNVTVATPKGCQWLAAAAPQPLTLLLPSHMEAEDTRLKQREAAEAQRAAERHAAQQRRDTEAEEKAALLAALRQARKTVADSLGQVRAGVCLCARATCVRVRRCFDACEHTSCTWPSEG
jgi:hypothetical protein